MATGAGLREDAVMTDQQQPAQDPVPGVVVTGEPADQQATESVPSPAKVMRIGAMVRQLLEEVRHAPLDEAGRDRMRDIYDISVRELADSLSPDLAQELGRLPVPSSARRPPARPSSGSPRPSSSAGSRASSTASRPPCSLSR